VPDNKCQHYVPRCYLKSFGIDPEGLATNLYNIPRSRSVRHAAIRGQCARDYFYGRDLSLEKILQEVEGQYAAILRKVIGGGSASSADLFFLRWFAVLQYARTDMAMRRAQIMHEGLRDVIHESYRNDMPEIDLSDEAMIRESMRVGIKLTKYVEDLKTCLLLNGTATDFITSDDPSIFTNRLHLQKWNEQNFSLGSSGALIFLPLTPRVALMCFDGQVYTVPEKDNYAVTLRDVADIATVNELQYLKANSNLYFQNWGQRVSIQSELPRVASRRPTTWCRFRVLVPDREIPGGTMWRVATDEERRRPREMLITTSSIYPMPSAWLSKLRYRNPIRTFSNGSAAGHVRKKIWLER